MKKANINAVWNYVKTRYPDARFDFWYSIGELHFWPNGEAEKACAPVYGCIVKNGSYVIMFPEEF